MKQHALVNTETQLVVQIKHIQTHVHCTPTKKLHVSMFGPMHKNITLDSIPAHGIET